MQLTTPEQLTSLINSLMINSAEKFDLNRRMANRTRQFFRAQIRAQRDVFGRTYTQRSQKKSTIAAKNRNDMFTGFSRMLRTKVSADAFYVGLSGHVGRIAKQHNDGETLSFSTRINASFNSRTMRWEGGSKVRNQYQLPKRTLIGWTPELEEELMIMICSAINQSIN